MVPNSLCIRFTSCLTVLAICGALAQLSACSRSEEAPAPPAPPAGAPAAPPAAPGAVGFQVTGVNLGSAIDADNKVTASAAGVSFKPTDTIYASISSIGTSANVALVARWTFHDGQLVSEATQTITTAGPAVTEFHISKPDGWPAGRYKLEVSANGKPAGAAEFTVIN